MSNILSKEFDATVQEKLKIRNIDLDAYENVSIQHFYHQLYINAKKELYRVESILDKEYQSLLHYYKFEFSYSIKDSQIDIYIKANEKYIETNKIYQLKKLECEKLEDVVKLFKERGYAIKNCIDLLKLERV